MRYLYFALFAQLTLFSCKKSTNSDNSPAEKGNMLISFSQYDPANQHKVVIEFTYDQDQQLAQIRAQRHDTTGSELFMDTSRMIFTGGGPTTPPFDRSV